MTQDKRKRRKRRIIKAILALIRGLIEVICGTSMLGIPALLVHKGYNITCRNIWLIWIPLAIVLVICLAIDNREVKREEARRFEANMRRYEREKQKYPERYR